MLGLLTGTPAVIIPTISERESNPRRVVALGAEELIFPKTDANGETRIDVGEFGAKVQRVLSQVIAYQPSAFPNPYASSTESRKRLS